MPIPEMKDAISQIVEDMAPNPGMVGLLTADDVRQIIERAANQGAMAGWVAGMRTARNAYEQARKAPND